MNSIDKSVAIEELNEVIGSTGVLCTGFGFIMGVPYVGPIGIAILAGQAAVACAKEITHHIAEKKYRRNRQRYRNYY